MIQSARRAFGIQVFVLAGGFIVLAALIGWRTILIESQRQDNLAVNATAALERHIVEIVSLAQDAETGQRGYLLTGEESYLAPYTNAAAKLPAELTATRPAFAGDPAQSRRFADLEAAVTQKLAELKQTVDLRQAGNAAGAIDIVRTDRGRDLMERIRALSGALREAEDDRLRTRLDTADRGGRWARLGSIGALGGVFLLGLYGVTTLRRRLTDIERGQLELAASNEKLRAEIATRQSAEAQVRQMQKMEAVGQLTGGIAHDFNNMLAVILGALNLMQRRLARGETDVQKFTDAAVDAATRAAGLTSRLLAFSRQQPLAPQVVEANRLVTGMSDLLRRTLGETIGIETVLAGGLWRTHSDPGQLENALINLAVNARDAMPDGGKLTIETANCHLDEAYAARHMEVPAGQYVLVAVTDTGEGMPASVIEKAFDPFFTTKAVGKGTGLGLSQVFGYVKQSGGHVKIYSEPGQGTTVKIYLPRFFGEEPKPKAATIPPVWRGKPTETILVVEDDDRVRALSIDSLRDLGYTVLHASTGAEALEVLAANPQIALLFTDIVMPGMNGRKLADEALLRVPHLKVLFTTGFTRNAVVHNGVLDHGVNFLAKPFTVDRLAGKVREVLDSA